MNNQVPNRLKRMGAQQEPEPEAKPALSEFASGEEANESLAASPEVTPNSALTPEKPKLRLRGKNYDEPIPEDAESITCPNCKTELNPGAVMCIECGIDARTGEKVKAQKKNP